MNAQIDMALAERDAGIAAVAARNQTFLETVRGAARMICRRQGTVTADDVRKWADENGIEPKHRNCWGAVFKTPDFEFAGLTRSAQVQGHGNRICVYRIKTA